MVINRLKSILLLSVSFCLAGCLVIPPVTKSHTISDNDLSSIAIGHITRNEVYKILGQPNRLEYGRYCVYEGENSHGTIIWAAPYGGGGAVDFGGPQYRILLEFDDNDVLRNYEIEKGVQRSDDPRIYPVAEESTPLNAQNEILLWKHPKGFATAWPPLIAASSCVHFIAANRSQGSIWVIDLQTMEKVKLENPKDIEYFRFSHDCRYLAYVTEFIYTFDLVTQLQVSTFSGHIAQGIQWFKKNRLRAVLDFFPDGNKIVSGGHDGFIRIWEIGTGIEIKSFKAYKESVLAIAVSPDGSMLATAGDTGIKLWDSVTGYELDHIKSAGDFRYLPYGLKFSPHSNLLAINKGSHVELILLKKKPRRFAEVKDAFLLPFAGHSNATCPWHVLDFSEDGRYLAASNGSGIVWDVEKKDKIWAYIPMIPTHSWWSLNKLWPTDYLPTTIYAITFNKDRNLSVVTTEGVKIIKMQLPN